MVILAGVRHVSSEQVMSDFLLSERLFNAITARLIWTKGLRRKVVYMKTKGIKNLMFGLDHLA